jgi:hypothetical protein
VRIGDRRGHQHLGFICGIAEHQALVAGTLLVIGSVIHTLGNVGRLLADGVEHGAGLAVEALVGMVIADVADDLAGQLFNVDIGFGGHFAGDHNHAGLDQRLAGHPRLGVLAQNRIEHAVGDLVCHLVGMSLGDGFRSEERSGHSVFLYCSLWSESSCNG